MFIIKNTGNFFEINSPRKLILLTLFSITIINYKFIFIYLFIFYYLPKYGHRHPYDYNILINIKMSKTDVFLSVYRAR